MDKVKIFTDSCSDLTAELRKKYDIEYVKMNTVLNDCETPASLDWEYYSSKEFYEIMRRGKRITTTQVTSKEFEEKFSYWLRQGYDIVYIGCSLKLSGSVNAGEVAARSLEKEYPNNKVYCIDSRNSCCGEGILSIRGAKYRDQGMSAQEIADRIMSERNNINQFCTVHSLDALKRAGRVKAASAFLEICWV